MWQMSGNNTMALDVGSGAAKRRIAYIATPSGTKHLPGLVWLSGFNSTMDGTKASDLAAWAKGRGQAMTRFDYSGHGQSSGRFEDGTISQWLEEAHAVVEKLTAGPQILIGSSMGGWIALLMARTLAARDPGRIAGLVLIAPAWDMTERLMWQTASEGVRQILETERVWHRPSEYDDNNYPITMALIEDGRKHLLGDAPAINTGCPVRILHGLEDPDVPWQGSHDLVDRLATDNAHLTLIKGGGHRLSEPEHVRLLKEMVAGLAG